MDLIKQLFVFHVREHQNEYIKDFDEELKSIITQLDDFSLRATNPQECADGNCETQWIAD